MLMMAALGALMMTPSRPATMLYVALTRVCFLHFSCISWSLPLGGLGLYILYCPLVCSGHVCIILSHGAYKHMEDSIKHVKNIDLSTQAYENIDLDIYAHEDKDLTI